MAFVKRLSGRAAQPFLVAEKGRFATRRGPSTMHCVTVV
jgi:hypothetical protein